MTIFKRKPRFLGIDISPSAVKLMEISRSGQRFQVEAIAMEPLPEGAMENRNPTDPDEVSNALKRALKSSGSHLRQAAVAVPTSNVITRTIPMPLEFDQDELEANIQLDAAQYIPFPLDEVYLDFQVQGRSKANAETQDVMLVATRRENVDLRETVLAEAGLKAAIVDVEAYALANTFSLLARGLLRSDNDARIALVDMGATTTTLYIFQDDTIIYTREQPFGSEQLTMAIADAYGLSRDKAELAKRSGELSEDYSSTILDPFKRSAAEQINHALQFFFSSSHYNTVDQISLMGGGALISGIAEKVADFLGIPTVVSNPFEHMSHAGRVNRRSLLRDAPLFAVACGLALRSFEQA